MDHICQVCGKLYVTETPEEEKWDENICPECQETEFQAELELSKKRCTCGAAQQGIVCFSC